jgi:hypothetical protein
MLHLAEVQGGQVGVVHLSLSNTQPRINSHTFFDLPPDTLPDATIAGTVEFILSEAQLYQRSQDDPD